MTRLAREGLLGPLARVNLQICEACLAGKACMKPFGKAVRVTQPLELVHSDICGPMSVKARHGASYFLTLIDDYMRYGYAYLISHCYEALDCFRRFVADVEKQKEKSLKTLCTDRDANICQITSRSFVREKGYAGNSIFAFSVAISPSKSLISRYRKDIASLVASSVMGEESVRAASSTASTEGNARCTKLDVHELAWTGVSAFILN
ncbi:hypothetical protein RJ640_019258 [Escallonia rubra]|uniref:Integrase catalytic domain-containing protein n=1 Tax=Escallonia rubra TaxID=112253 RepID=A0AA88RYF0_9ASTE|nr:hypothetical protein RJ640_019258 [Escallonia rubra]